MIPLLVLLSFIGIASAQFQFFEGMFGGHHHQQQQQQQQQQRSGAEQYSAQVDAVSCSKYLCPTTLDCVDYPVHCPCLYEEDVKCIIPDTDANGSVGDGTVVCVRGGQSCTEMEKLLQKGRT